MEERAIELFTVRPVDGETPKRHPQRDTARAYHALNSAEHKRKYADEIKGRDPIGAMFERNDANDMAARAQATIDIPPGFVEQGTGGELTVPEEDRVDRPALMELVRESDWVNINASRERIDLLAKAEVFNLGADTAESIKAKDALEKMLAHQMAAAHRMSMTLIQRASNERNTIEQARLANTAARLMDTYQRAMLTLNRIRSGGRQLVTVQHVSVAGGGQAVVTGPVHTGGHLTGGCGGK